MQKNINGVDDLAMRIQLNLIKGLKCLSPSRYPYC
jgi:hypothetical protein